MSILRTTITCVLAGSLLASQMGPAGAAPLPTNIAAMKSAATDSPIQVYWLGGWGTGGPIFGEAMAPPPVYYGYPYRYYYGSYGYYGPYGYPYHYARPYAVYPRYYGGGWYRPYW